MARRMPQNVILTDPTPANTTFVSAIQPAGPCMGEPNRNRHRAGARIGRRGSPPEGLITGDSVKSAVNPDYSLPTELRPLTRASPEHWSDVVGTRHAVSRRPRGWIVGQSS